MAARLTKTKVSNALQSANGIISAAAVALRCERQTIYNWIEREPDLGELLDQLRETRIDRAENKLDEAIDNGEQWAVALVLRTIGRKRGYGDNVDVTTGGEPVRFTIQIDRPDDNHA